MARLIWTMRRFAALAPLLMLILSAPEQVLLRCRYDGRVRTACCCPAERDAHSAQRPPSMKAACCCDREVVAAQASLAEPSSATHAGDVLPPPVLLAVEVAIEPPRLRAVPRELARGRSGDDGPPLILLKQTLLI
jgi:hypothetical protein